MERSSFDRMLPIDPLVSQSIEQLQASLQRALDAQHSSTTGSQRLAQRLETELLG